MKSIKIAKNRKDAFILETMSHRYYVAFGAGRTEHVDGTVVDTDAAFSLVRGHEGLTMVHGSRFLIDSTHGRSEALFSGPVSYSYVSDSTGPIEKFSGNVAYETRGGIDHVTPLNDIPKPEVSTSSVQGTWFSGSRVK